MNSAMMAARFAPLFFAVLLSSCISVDMGRDIPADKVAKLRVGVTSRPQVIELLGNPYERVEAINERGAIHFGDTDTVVILRYESAHADLFSQNGAYLEADFNGSGMLVDYQYIDGGKTKDADFNILNARNRIVPGKSTKADVAALLGANYTVLPFNNPGVAQRWYFAHSESSQTETCVIAGVSVPKTYVKSLFVDFDAAGIVQHVRGKSDFPRDLQAHT
jgi:outer membrane protein assembly factor BamE (lipoprotein component of BamABCDE complex)